MLIEFRVKNLLSFKEEQAFSMVASPGGEHRTTHCIPAPVKGVDLVRSAVIHGANAAGKTNLIRALELLRYCLCSNDDNPLSRITPFRLAEETLEAPAEFEVFFIQDGVRYQYGAVIDAKQVHNEWLFAFPQGRTQRLFERNFNESASEPGYEWYFNDKQLGSKGKDHEFYKKSTRANVLFLAQCAKNLNNGRLLPVYEWFRSKLRILHYRPSYNLSIIDRMGEPLFKKRVIDLLNGADFSVVSIEVEEQEKKFPSDMPEPLREILSKEIVVTHGGNGMSHKVPLTRDSSGTAKLFGLTDKLFDALDHQQVLVVDELNSSMHPLLLQELVRMFHQTNSQAQLIFSNHDVSMLDLDLFRRDQIWFISKDRHHASVLYPLTDFHPRKNENIERSYLQARYGAIPYLSFGENG